jgi:hypothetical protein
MTEPSDTRFHRDEEDVPMALAKETQDGRGEEELAPSDFKGFPTEGVEKEDDS